MTVMFIMGGLAVVLGIAQVLMLWAVCRLFGAQRATILRAAGVTVTTFVAYCALLIGVFAANHRGLQLLILVVGGIGLVVLNIWLIKSWLQLSKWRSVGAWLLSGIAYSLVSTGIVYGFRYGFAEAFSVPTNSMAPAILGRHRRGECPLCHGPLIVSVRDQHPFYFDDFGPYLGICLDCQQSGEVAQVASEIIAGDRIMTDKTTAPRRWDVVAFRPPVESDGPYVKRLVGLPGETIEFRDDTVYINGKAAQLPAEISKLKHFSSEFSTEHGLGDGPVRLGEDEYVVLGDNSKNAMDSRYFGPIKSSDIIGVITVTYWPASRWRVWR